MKYKAYSSYKDSGVEWLGEIPEHWEVKPFWTLYTRIKRTNHINEELLSVYRDYGVIPKSSRDDNDNKPSEDLSPYQLVEIGDIALNKMKAWQGSLGVSSFKGIVSPAYFVFKPTHTEYFQYLHYLLRSPQYIVGYLSLSKGIRVNQWDLDPQYHSRMGVLLPSIQEQQQIATYLDKATTKIDTLIAKQEKLIELLKEKRQAVISHAVTKGLNPDVAMKDSGVEWLGEIPEHWELTRAKFVSNIFIPQRNKPTLNESSGIYWLTMDDMRFPNINKTSLLVNTESVLKAGSKILKKGSVIASCVGNFGIASINEVNVIINQQLQAYIPFKINKYFLRLYITISSMYYESIGTAATLIYVNREGFENLPIILPPLKEQKNILNHLNKTTNKIDNLTKKSIKSITLLKEKRTALISAAVTGKIDVRDKR